MTTIKAQYVTGLTYKFTEVGKGVMTVLGLDLHLPDDDCFVCSGTDKDGDALTRTEGAYITGGTHIDHGDDVLIAPIAGLLDGVVVLVADA